jgi:dUTP pyrophosphatase
MIAPLFYTDPGNELFVPTIAHPGEDAGADIKACVEGAKDSVKFYRDFETWTMKYGTRLYVDGEVFTSESESDFLDVIDGCGGAVLLPPGETVLVNSGFKIILPSLLDLGYPWNSLIPVYKIMSRSGLAHKHGVVVTNAPGIIDSGYQDWVKVSLTNRGSDWHAFTRGSRIAQGLCEMVIDQSLAETTTSSKVFEVTGRSTGGFGSTKV